MVRESIARLGDLHVHDKLRTMASQCIAAAMGGLQLSWENAHDLLGTTDGLCSGLGLPDGTMDGAQAAYRSVTADTALPLVVIDDLPIRADELQKTTDVRLKALRDAGGGKKGKHIVPGRNNAKNQLSPGTCHSV